MGTSFKDIIGRKTFVGIVNFNNHKKEAKPLKDYISNHIAAGGGIIYVYSRKDGEQSLENLKEVLKQEIESIYNPHKIVVMCKDDYLKENRLDVDGLLEEGRKELDRLDESGCRSNLVYVDIDRIYNAIGGDELQSIYNRIKAVSLIRNIRFIFRYMMECIELDYENTLLTDYELLLIEKGNDIKRCTPAELIHQSLIRICKECYCDRICDKEIKRIEHLKALGDIMEGAVHDINNLLSTIAGYVQLSLAMDERPEIMKYLDIINKTALDGRNTIDNIKSYIRGSSSNSKAYYSFDDIVNKCIVMTKYKFKTSAIKENKDLEIDISLNSNALIYGNEYEIRHSLLNIIFNGIDAMGDSGVLTIKTYDKNGKAIVEISDTGKGIDEEDLDRIFDPYYTTKGSTSTGLGLNIVKNVVENHNGRIHIDSKVGKGTKFILSFPILEGGEETAPSIGSGLQRV